MFSAEFSLKPSVDILLQTAEGRIICGIEKNISKDHCLIGRIIWHSVFCPEIQKSCGNDFTVVVFLHEQS